MQAADDVTQLLYAWSQGREDVHEALFSKIYEELHRLACYQLRRERNDHTLRPTALIHEAYLRLIQQTRTQWQSRSHFFAVSSKVMRRVLVDASRRRSAQKRGGQEIRVTLDEARDQAHDEGVDFVALDDALQSLAQLDTRQAQVVELRFFGGLSIDDIAGHLEISPATVKRDWTSARAWLYCQLQGS